MDLTRAVDPEAPRSGDPRVAISDRERKDVLEAHPEQNLASRREEAGHRMVKTGVRPLEGEVLRRGVERLRTLVYPDHPEAYEVEWHDHIWSWLGTHPLAEEMHRWVIATGEDEVVGHLAAVPQYYRINGRRVIAHTPADYQALPGYGFHALSLMRRFFGAAENCVSVDGVEEAIAVEKRLGAEESGRLRYAVKLLDPSQPSRLPEPLRPLLRPARYGIRAADGALGALFARGPEVERLDVSFDDSFDELFEGVAAAMPCVPEKDAAFLRWRYGAGSPQFPVTVLGVKDGENLLGYAVLRVTREGKDGYVMDLTTRPGRRDVARSLLRETVRFFAQAGVYIIRYRFMESPTSPLAGDLNRLGFFFREGRRHTLLVKFADAGLHKTALDPANWSYTTGDGEAAYWMR